MKPSVPLRFSIPLALGVLAVALTAVAFVHDWVRSEKEAESLTLRRAAALGYIVTPTLERAVATGNGSVAADEIERLALVPQLTVAFVSDAANRVMYATDSALLSRIVSETPVAAQTLITRARTTMSAQLEITADGTAARAAFPFQLGLLPGELRPSRTAVLFIAMDLASLKKEALAGIVRRSLVMGAAALVACLVVWAYLHIRLTRRVDELVERVVGYSPGHRDSSTLAHGGDELARIGQAVSQMIADLSAQHTALREAELRFRTLFDRAPVGVVVIEPGTARIIEANEMAARQLGYPMEEFLTRSIGDFEVVETPEDTHARIGKVTREGRDAFETQHLTRTGEVRDIWVSTKSLELSGRTVFHTILLDITDRKRAAEALRESEERFRRLIENASDLIMVVNHEGVIRYQSPSATRLLGYAPEEMVGRSAFDFVHPGDRSMMVAALKQVVASHDAQLSAESRIRHKNGQWRILQSIGRDIPGQAEDGFIVVNSRDVTDSRQLEEQLRQSQKMEAIGQLAGGVAHDFNNILSVIMMQTDLAAMTGSVPDDVQDGLRQVRAAAERATKLTRQLLLFGRRQVMQFLDLDVNDVVTNHAAMLQRIIGEDVHLHLRLHPSPLTLRADVGMLDQVLMNLGVNARDAMPEGGRLVIETSETIVDDASARLQTGVAAGRYVCLRVSDSGAGIAPDVMPRIFEPFFTTKESDKGTGLGLATVFGIVKQHRGWITVDSEPGRGASFQVFLPAHTTSTVEPPKAGTASKARGGTETILVVEDEAAVRMLTRAALERYGYTVLEAETGTEALASWPEYRDRVTLLLTDLVMPGGVGGHELAERLRADRPDLTVVYFSGYSADIAGRELQLRPGENFVQKPFTVKQLLDTVRRSLDAPRSSQIDPDVG